MKTKCISRELTEEQRVFFKVPPVLRTKHQISIGKEYLVLGISFEISSPIYGNTALLQIVNDAGRCAFIPTALFEVIDGRCSSFWETRLHEGGAVTLWPIEFYEPYFHDDLSNHDPAARQLFDSVFRKMRAEFGD